MAGYNGETQPLRLQELGMDREQIAARATHRRLLFTFFIALFCLVVGAMAYVVKQRHIQMKQKRIQDQDGSSGKTLVVPPSLVDLNKITAKGNLVPPGCESTIMIMRHCEKSGPSVPDDDGNQHCSYLGHERARFIPSLFGQGNIWPAPDSLYALSPPRDTYLNFREIESLLPLAQKFGLSITNVDSNEHLAMDYFERLATGELCGKLVVVNWKHSYIGDLARINLGCTNCPKDFPESFDEVWQLKFVFDVLHTEIMKEKYYPLSESDALIDNSKSVYTNGGQGEHDNARNRFLRKTKKKWSVFSTVTNQNFDPLKFSYTVGDYGEGSDSVGGKWMSASTPELNVNEEM